MKRKLPAMSPALIVLGAVMLLMMGAFPSTASATDDDDNGKSTLKVTKICVPSNDPGEFNILVNGQPQGQVGCGESVMDIELGPGTHTVSETAVPPTVLANYTRTFGGDCNADGEVVVENGGDDDNGDDDNGDDDNGDDDGDDNGDGDDDGDDLQAMNGDDDGDDDGDDNGDDDGDDNGDGRDLRCTITNTRIAEPEEDTTLIITKECTGGVTGGSFNIVLTGGPGGNFNLGCGGSTAPIEVAADADLTVSETTTGFDTSFRGACDGDGSVILVEGEANTCVVSNAGLITLTITKECGAGVTSADGPFNFTLVGSINDTFSIATCGGSHEVDGVNEDDTSVLTETNTGFDVSIRGDCDGDGTLLLIANDDNVCVVTNNLLDLTEETTLVITKECTAGVTGGSFDITLSGDLSDSFTLGCGGSIDPIEVDSDANLMVGETTTGFDTSFRGACDGDGSVSLVEGEENTCVVSNKTLTTLTIEKECGEGVTDADGPFNFTLAGSINDTFSIAACGGTHEVEGVGPNDTGILSETDTGFEVSIRGDCDGDGTLILIPNDNNVCVVNNSLEDGEDDTTLIITKECAAGVTGGSFDISLSGDISDSFTLGCDGSTDAMVVDVGATLTVAETTKGFDTSFRGACDGDGSVDLVEDDENICVVTNRTLTTLTITKECGEGVTSADGPFNFELSGSINDTFSIATCGGSHAVVGVNPNDTGTLVETNTGFEVSIRGDCDGDGSLELIANDNNICVVSNSISGAVGGETPGGDTGVVLDVLPPAGVLDVQPSAAVLGVSPAPGAVSEVAGVTSGPPSAVLGVAPSGLPATGSGGSDLASGPKFWVPAAAGVIALAVAMGLLGYGRFLGRRR